MTDTDPMHVSAAHLLRNQQHRFPWCDTCKMPAVFREGQGLLHSTDAFPFGLPPHLDTSGHEVTVREWNAPTGDTDAG